MMDNYKMPSSMGLQCKMKSQEAGTLMTSGAPQWQSRPSAPQQTHSILRPPVLTLPMAMPGAMAMPATEECIDQALACTSTTVRVAMSSSLFSSSLTPIVLRTQTSGHPLDGHAPAAFRA